MVTRGVLKVLKTSLVPINHEMHEQVHTISYTNHIQGKITECVLAGTKGIFSVITRTIVVIKRARLVDAD